MNGFKVPIYFAAPAGKTNLPVVLVIQEIFGVHEYIADTCRRFAKAGYLAIATELFARQGDPTTYGEIAKLIAEVVNKVPDAQVMSDLDAAVAWAGKSGSGDVSRVGVTGFCWGGRIVWLYAAHSRTLKAGVAWYGRLTGETTPLQPKYPLSAETLARQALTPSLLLRTLARGQMALFVHAMAELTATPHARAWLMIHDAGPLGLRAIYDRAGLPRRGGASTQGAT